MTLDAFRSSAPSTDTGARAADRRARRGAPAADVSTLAAEFGAAREDDELVVLEGFHPLKHALRFGAGVGTIATYDAAELSLLARNHAPELAADMAARAVELSRKDFRRLGPYEPHTGVVSIARRVRYDAQDVLADARPAPVVLLDDPRHRGNFGAVVRVAAAAGAVGVLGLGELDPWHPVVARGAAGLQFAVPVARLEELPDSLGARPLVVLDPAGEPLIPSDVPARPLLVFGSERRGVSARLLERAHARLALPMSDGVSSLNLATSVAAVLYGLRLA